MTTKKTGDKGEDQALLYLAQHGYAILGRNYRYKRAEIDIIARHNDLLIFVEVKVRKNADYGFPETFVDKKKADLIKSAATAYMEAENWRHDVRFDIVAITNGQLEHFEDAF
jgi:putative endonuclease